MTPQALIPRPDVLQVPWGWFQALLVFTFILHLLLMNTMLGNAILAVFAGLGRNEDYLAMEKQASLNLPYTIAFTVNIGVAPLLFLQVLYGNLVYASSVLMAVYWLSVVGMLIIAYYCAYIYDFKFEALGAGRTFLIGASAVLMLAVGFIFTNNMTMMLVPAKWQAYFDNPNGTILNLSEPTLIPRYLHFVTASVAIGGLSQAIYWKIRQSKGRPEAGARVAIGMRWFLRASLAQLVLGTWFLLALPERVLGKLTGGAAYPSVLLVAAVLGVLLVLYSGFKQRVWLATAGVVATVSIMVLIRDLVRAAYLAPFFSVTDLKVAPQYSPMIMFLVSFAVGLVIVAYMLKLAAAAGKEA